MFLITNNLRMEINKSLSFPETCFINTLKDQMACIVGIMFLESQTLTNVFMFQ